MFSALPATDLPVLVTSGYYRLAADRYFVPISVAVPGSAIPTPAEKDKDKMALDILGFVRDEQGRPVGNLQQTITLPPGSVGSVAAKQVLYTTALQLPPGSFLVKVVVRENTSGLMGSFQAAVVVPELKSAALKVSAITLAHAPAGQGHRRQPAIRGGQQLGPTSRIVARSWLLFTTRFMTGRRGAEPSHEPRVLSQQGEGVRDACRLNGPPSTIRRKAAIFQFEVPGIAVFGFYTRQINGSTRVFEIAFPRLAVFLLPDSNLSSLIPLIRIPIRLWIANPDRDPKSRILTALDLQDPSAIRIRGFGLRSGIRSGI